MTSLQKFSAKSATRVDFAGGTLDLWPLSTLIHGAFTINSSIDCYTSVEFEKNSNFEIKVESPDFKESFVLEDLASLFSATDPRLSILKEAFAAFDEPANGVGSWLIKSESPAGSGLGGSSSLLISILKVIFKIESKAFTETSIINTAKNIESRVLGGPAGIQDYFSPVKEGLNVINYKEDGFVRDNLEDCLIFWKEAFTIVDSQIKHHSGMNNWEILKSFIDGDKKTVGALNEIASVSSDVLEALKEKSIRGLATAFAKELEARKKVSDSYVNKDLEAFIAKLSSINEIKAFKICGAGGGGCLLLLHEPNLKTQVAQSLKDLGVALLPFQLTE